jgi:hypothetical protein
VEEAGASNFFVARTPFAPSRCLALEILRVPKPTLAMPMQSLFPLILSFTLSFSLSLSWFRSLNS